MRHRALLALTLLFACGEKEPSTDSDAPDDSASGEVDADGDGSPAGQDCDDADAAIHPGAAEVCDGVDNDCDALIDDADDDVTDARTFYEDVDGDGFAGRAVVACALPEGGSETSDDCDDADAAVYPGAQELCNERDDDCDGLIDDEDDDWTGGVEYYVDVDGDGYGSRTERACEPPEDAAEQGGDCNDGDPSINPGAEEVCDGRDNDCDRLVDGDDDSLGELPVFYQDDDGDGYGGDATVSACEAPSGYAELDGDCDDDEATVNPGETEQCADGLDNDCSGTADDGCYTSLTGTREYQEGLGAYGDRDCETYFNTTGTAVTQVACPECDYSFETINSYDRAASSYTRCRLGRTSSFIQRIGFDEDYFGYGYPAVWLEYAQSRYNYGYYYYYPLIYGVTVDTTNHTASWYYGYYEYPYGRGLYETYWLAGEVTFSY
ncbi:MAG: putative metal-binding motif-containing protein [Alphaproteobacteria bacterium]|nr:putative metal-binding motif-containing protein [Alphaproteobacteria bacterium]